MERHPKRYRQFRLYNASDFGVSQTRLRVFIVATLACYADAFIWPQSGANTPANVGDVLFDLMTARGWRGAKAWRGLADGLAPTIVGGSRKHGGPDLGPTRTREAWSKLGVNAKSLADEAPERGFVGIPRLAIPMVARLQGFPDSWVFSGGKTSAYRQIGNALPPPVAHAIAYRIRKALQAAPAVNAKSPQRSLGTVFA